MPRHPAAPPVGSLTYLGHEEQVAATGGRYCPSPGVGTGEEGVPRHCRIRKGTLMSQGRSSKGKGRLAGRGPRPGEGMR